MKSEGRKDYPLQKIPQTFEELTARLRGNFVNLEDKAKAMGQELQDAKTKTEGLARRLLSEAPKSS